MALVGTVEVYGSSSRPLHLHLHQQQQQHQHQLMPQQPTSLSSSPADDEETAIVRCLQDDGFGRRSEVLEKIRSDMRISGALHFTDRPALFRALNRTLADGNWDVRHQCAMLLAEAPPLLGNAAAVDECFAPVLARLVASVGDGKISVRRVVCQALHTYMRHTASVANFLRSLVANGLDHVEPKVRREAVVALPVLLTTDFADENYTDVIASLCHKLDGGMRPDDASTQRAALVTLDRLRELVGETRFREQLASCGQLVRDCYCRAVAADFRAAEGTGATANAQQHPSAATAAAVTIAAPVSVAMSRSDPSRGGVSEDGGSQLELGVLPPGLLAQLDADRDDFRVRSQAAERLKEVFERLPPRGGASSNAGGAPSSTVVGRNMGALLSVVGGLLDDANFRVVTLALDALAVLIDRAGRDARPHVRTIVTALTRRMGDNKAVVRASVARAALQLMQSLGPQPVLAALSDNTGHRNSRVRAETLNLLIAALLTFPSTDIDLPAACSSAACCLADSRRAVRHAALECVAVLAQCLGPARSAPLARAVEAVELHYDGRGVAEAVGARLSRRVLPRRDADGLVEYALQLPVSGGGAGGGSAGKANAAAGGSSNSGSSGANGSAGSTMPPGADIDWVMAGSGAGGGGGSSARSIRLEDLEVTAAHVGSLADVTSSPPTKRQAAVSGTAASMTVAKLTPRGRLPWNDGAPDAGGGANSSTQPASHAASGGIPNGNSRAFALPSAAPPHQTWTEASPQQHQHQVSEAVTNGTTSLKKLVARRPSNGVGTAGDAGGTTTNGSAADVLYDGEMPQSDHPSGGSSSRAAAAVVRGVVPLSHASSAAGASQQQQQQVAARPAFTKAPSKGSVASTAAVATAPPAAAAPASYAAGNKAPPDIRGDLSSSWPGNKRFALLPVTTGSDENAGGGGGGAPLGRRQLLDPISAPDTPVPSQLPSPAWSGGDAEERRMRAGRDVYLTTGGEDGAPVPVKPKLVRSASRGRPPAAAAAGDSAGGGSKASQHAPLPPERSSSPRLDGLVNGAADDGDSSYGTLDLDENGGDVQDGLMSSVSKIRHSASKKKAEKLFRKLELKQSLSAGGAQDGSGSNTARSAVSPSALSPEPPFSSMSALLTGTSSSTKSNPFEAKPKLARRSSQPLKATGSPASLADDGAVPTARHEPVRPEFNPLAGVTFRRGGEQADGVSVVGRGYGDDSGATADPRSNVAPPGNSNRQQLQREKRRAGLTSVAAVNGKGPRLSPLAIAAARSSTPDEERVTVVGHGMFDGGAGAVVGGAAADHQSAQQVAQSVTSRSLVLAAPHLKGSDPGLIPVHTIATAMRPVGGEPDTAEDAASGEDVVLAPALRDQMAARRREKAEEAAAMRRRRQQQQQADEEAEIATRGVEQRLTELQQEQPISERRRREPAAAADKRPRLAPDRRPQEDRQLEWDASATADAADYIVSRGGGAVGSTAAADDGSPASLLVAGVAPTRAAGSDSKPPTGKRGQPPARRRTASPAGFAVPQPQPPPPPHSAGGGSGPEELSPLSDPDAALRDAYRLLADDDWNTKYDGMMAVRRLAAHHDDLLREHTHPVTVALVKEVQNLRSQVARLAIVTIGDLFAKLKRGMDSELESAAKVLLHKNGESNDFIRVELEKSLRIMVEETTPMRALTAVIAGGSTHRNPAVRRVVAQLLDTLTEKLGPDRLLSGAKDVSDRFLPVLAQLTTDASPETRWYARKILVLLMDHQDFERTLAKHLPVAMQRSVKEVCEGLRTKGLGDMPIDAPSAKGRRSGVLSRSRTGSSDSMPLLGIDAPSGGGLVKTASAVASTPPVVRKALFRIGDEELVRQLCASLTASDWQQRYDAVTELADLCDSNPDLVASHISKIFEKFIPLLRDSNSKVNLHALQTLADRILARLAGSIGQVTSLTVQTAAGNLASKNREVCNAATHLLDAFVEHLDNALLIQPFANQATVCTAKVKPPLIERVRVLAELVYPRKPKHVVLHVLPLLWQLLGLSGSPGVLRTATADLVTTLYRLMGASLLEEAAGNSLVSPACVSLLRDMIDGGDGNSTDKPAGGREPRNGSVAYRGGT